jgi:hypothetical protein
MDFLVTEALAFKDQEHGKREAKQAQEDAEKANFRKSHKDLAAQLRRGQVK